MGKNKLNNDYDEVLRVIADNVLYYRKQQGYSQEKLAALAEVDRTYIGYIENAHHNVGVRILCQIAQVLKLNVEDLIVTRRND
jgi:transcriptional regulator with XRE-family HTH domain